MLGFIIPIISSPFFRCGGWGEIDNFCPALPNIKYPVKWGWLVGRLRNLIGVLPFLLFGNLLGIVAYALAVEIPYGDNDKNILRKLVGRDANWLIYGAAFGLCSFFYLGIINALVQGAIGAVAFYSLMKWSNDGYQKEGKPKYYLNHAYVELGFGMLGTIMYLFK